VNFVVPMATRCQQSATGRSGLRRAIEHIASGSARKARRIGLRLRLDANAALTRKIATPNLETVSGFLMDGAPMMTGSVLVLLFQRLGGDARDRPRASSRRS